MSNSDFNIHTVLKELKKRRKYFSSEADFQLAVAMQIEKIYGDNSVICKYVPDYESKVENSGSRIHIDILYCKENIPIELKYRTKKADLKEMNYDIHLVDQGAHDEGSYGFWRDVSRIGEYIGKTRTSKGLVVFLTNDSWYQNPEYGKCKVDYKEYDLNEKSIKNRSGCISNNEKKLVNIPNIDANWYEWDIKEGFVCYVAEITNN